MRKFVRKIALLFMVCGLAVNMASAERPFRNYSPQEQAKIIIDAYEEFKAKYPKTYKACFEQNYESKYYDSSTCDYIFTERIIALKWRDSGGYEEMSYRYLEQKYGEAGKAKLLKNGVNGYLSEEVLGNLKIAEGYAKISERR